MKKVQLLAAAALLFAGTAYGQTTKVATTGERQKFSEVSCQDCVVDIKSSRGFNTTNANTATVVPATAIDNCSSVIQQGDNSTAIVEQEGSGNSAALQQNEGDRNYSIQSQFGEANQAKALIFGEENTTLQFQKGDGNSAGINVDQIVGLNTTDQANGNRNWAQQDQRGDDNIANINVYGDDNFSSQFQLGDDNSGDIYQRANKSSATQDQRGDNNTAITQQGVFVGTPTTGATEIGQQSCINQTGDSNMASVTQNIGLTTQIK